MGLASSCMPVNKNQAIFAAGIFIRRKATVKYIFTATGEHLLAPYRVMVHSIECVCFIIGSLTLYLHLIRSEISHIE